MTAVKVYFYTVLFLYICMFDDMLHILLSCDSLRDPWNVYCIVLYCIVLYRIVSYCIVSYCFLRNLLSQNKKK